MALKKIDIVNAICKKIGCTRRDYKLPQFSKRELLHLHSFVSLNDDQQAPKESDENGKRSR